MKKQFFLILILFSAGAVFASGFSLSTGAGGLFGYTFTRYTLEGSSISSTQNMDRIDYAAFVFIDAKYVEFSVMFKGGYSTWEENLIYDQNDPEGSSGGRGTGTETSVGFSLIGKYPFTVNESLIWFPMLGVEYHIALMQRRQPQGGFIYDRTSGMLAEDQDKDGDSYPLSAWNSFWINLGAGADYSISSRFFIRSELLFGFRLPTAYENGALEVIKKMGANNPRLAGLTGSPMLKIGVGYNIF